MQVVHSLFNMPELYNNKKPQEIVVSVPPAFQSPYLQSNYTILFNFAITLSLSLPIHTSLDLRLMSPVYFLFLAKSPPPLRSNPYVVYYIAICGYHF